MTRPSRALFSLICCCFILLLAACGTGGTSITPTPTTPSASQTAATGSTPTPAHPSPTITTAPEPPTQTNCPAAGTERAAVMAPLALGNHPTIVYEETHFNNGSSSAAFMRYDVTTGAKSAIHAFPNEVIRDPQLSADGQWILFDNSTIQQDQLQMIRMDGQGLQTLYCGSALSNIIWSSNEQLVLFSVSAPPQGLYGIDLLNLHTGTVQLELKPTQTNLGSVGVYPVTWLDNTRAYLTFTTEPFAPFDRLGILDTSKGPNQSASNLVAIYQDKRGTTFNYPCWDADSSYNGSTLYAVHCSGISAPNCSGSCSLGTREGPSTIYTEPATGGALQTMFTSQALGIAQVRSITSSLLLLNVENVSQNHPVDTSQNGLWVVHSDGSGLTRLTTETGKTFTALCQFSQNPWSNVSRDSSMYAYQTSLDNPTAGTTAYTLFYGSLNGGATQSFASFTDNTQLAIIGWATM